MKSNQLPNSWLITCFLQSFMRPSFANMQAKSLTRVCCFQPKHLPNQMLTSNITASLILRSWAKYRGSKIFGIHYDSSLSGNTLVMDDVPAS